VHIIIFDEIDALCKQRGSSRDGTGVGDSVVNQLLTQIDGVDSLNNVLVIGMTNRKVRSWCQTITFVYFVCTYSLDAIYLFLNVGHA
jgi:hypothetical protein